MTIEDLIKIMVAADKKVVGKTKIMKILFLLVDNFFPELKDEIDFFPYQFGPYSTESAKVINRMIKSGDLIPKKVGRTWEVTLSEKAQEEGQRLLESLEHKDEIIELVHQSNEESLKTILSKIYSYYPEYAYNSRILDQVMEG